MSASSQYRQGRVFPAFNVHPERTVPPFGCACFSHLLPGKPSVAPVAGPAKPDPNGILDPATGLVSIGQTYMFGTSSLRGQGVVRIHQPADYLPVPPNTLNMIDDAPFTTIVETQQGSPLQNEIQTVTHDGDGGSFTLTFKGQVTTDIVWNAPASTVQGALQALSTIGSNNVTVSGSNPWTITFANALQKTDMPILKGNSEKLTKTPSGASQGVPTGLYAIPRETHFWFNLDTEIPPRDFGVVTRDWPVLAMVKRPAHDGVNPFDAIAPGDKITYTHNQFYLRTTEVPEAWGNDRIFFRVVMLECAQPRAFLYGNPEPSIGLYWVEPFHKQVFDDPNDPN